MDVKMNKIKSEEHFTGWFEKNFKKLGYTKIIKKNVKKFPDFIMLRNNKEIRVELETLSSNFILHKHDKDKVDEVICIEKDIELGIPIRKIKGLEYIGGKERVSATVDESTYNIVKILIKTGTYRNKSHVIEEAIKILKKKNEKK